MSHPARSTSPSRPSCSGNPIDAPSPRPRRPAWPARRSSGWTRTASRGASSWTCSARPAGPGSARRSRSRISTRPLTRSPCSPPRATTCSAWRSPSVARWPTGCRTPASTCPSGTRAIVPRCGPAARSAVARHVLRATPTGSTWPSRPRPAANAPWPAFGGSPMGSRPNGAATSGSRWPSRRSGYPKARSSPRSSESISSRRIRSPRSSRAAWTRIVRWRTTPSPGACTDGRTPSSRSVPGRWSWRRISLRACRRTWRPGPVERWHCSLSGSRSRAPTGSPPSGSWSGPIRAGWRTRPPQRRASWPRSSSVAARSRTT